jgi:tetratricopeptide (TPR) repeat protein
MIVAGYLKNTNQPRGEFDRCSALVRVVFLFMLYNMWLLLFPGCGSNHSQTVLSPDQFIVYGKALDLYNQGRYLEAAEGTASLSRTYPGLLLRGKALFFASCYEEAVGYLSKALKRRPSSVEARLYLAYCYRSLGKDKQAREIAEELLADDSSNIRAYRLLLDLSEPGPGRTRLLEQALEATEEAAFLFIERGRDRWIRGDGPGALADLGAARTLLNSSSLLIGPLAALEKTIRVQMEKGIVSKGSQITLPRGGTE